MSANDQEIKNRGERRIEFRTDENKMKALMFQSAEVGRALISVAKLNEAGSEVILNKKFPRIITKSGDVIKLKRKGNVFILSMWVRVPSEEKNEEGSGKPKSGFARPGR